MNRAWWQVWWWVGYWNQGLFGSVVLIIYLFVHTITLETSNIVSCLKTSRQRLMAQLVVFPYVIVYQTLSNHRNCLNYQTLSNFKHFFKRNWTFWFEHCTNQSNPNQILMIQFCLVQPIYSKFQFVTHDEFYKKDLKFESHVVATANKPPREFLPSSLTTNYGRPMIQLPSNVLV